MIYKTLMCVMSLCALSSIEAFEITEDDRYVYTRRTWNEIADDRQRDLMRHFDDKLCNELDQLKIPHSWNEEAEKALIGSQDQFRKIIAETQSQANKYAADKNIKAQDLIPTGFILGFGVGGSGNFVVALGGSALLTFIVVPIEVERFDKVTRLVDKYYEVSWALGGFGQAGVGVGGGGGVVLRGAIGVIWGPLPEASALNGLAIGATANVGAVTGLGFKLAFVFNSTTHKHNLVALATYDMGAELSAGIEGSVFYFTSAKEVMSFMSDGKLDNIAGSSIVTSADLQATNAGAH